MFVGIGMANTLIECFPVMITLGISSSIETLVSQHYGKGQYKMCGSYLNKQIVLITSIFIPIVLIFYYSKIVMVDILHQNEEAAEHCQKYLRFIIPALYIDCIFDSFEIYLTAMERTIYILVIQVMACPLHVCWCYLFTQRYNFGLTGIAMAQTITSFMRIIILFFLLNLQIAKDIRKSFASLNKGVLKGMRAFT